MSAILYAEDEPNDIIFLKRAFQLAGSPHDLHSVLNGEQALDYLGGHGDFADRARYPLPALILLDINMPKRSGFDVLEWVRDKSPFKSLPVLMLTSSERPEDMEKARLLRADDYLLKPSDPRKLVALVKSVHDRWLSQPTNSPSRPAPSMRAEDAG